MLLPQLNQQALKEWSIAVDALRTGETIMLLRKGGIRERGFKVKHLSFWLYPTYEHQNPALLKPKYSELVVPVKSGWHPSKVEIAICAKITHTLLLNNQNQIKKLLPYQIWNDRMIAERLKWKPAEPIVILLLRVYCLPNPLVIDYIPAYGGCKSWINIDVPDGVLNSAKSLLTPAVEESKYARLTQEIEKIVKTE
ncbi:MAG: DUF1802 family protein [Cyanobacteria bacterium P01_G01_bin.19]